MQGLRKALLFTIISVLSLITMGLSQGQQKVCVDFENLRSGSSFGAPKQTSGTVISTQQGIRVSLETLFGTGLFRIAHLESAKVQNFGTGQFMVLDDVNLLFDFSNWSYAEVFRNRLKLA